MPQNFWISRLSLTRHRVIMSNVDSPTQTRQWYGTSPEFHQMEILRLSSWSGRRLTSSDGSESVFRSNGNNSSTWWNILNKDKKPDADRHLGHSRKHVFKPVETKTDTATFLSRSIAHNDDNYRHKNDVLLSNTKREYRWIIWTKQNKIQDKDLSR